MGWRVVGALQEDRGRLWWEVVGGGMKHLGPVYKVALAWHGWIDGLHGGFIWKLETFVLCFVSSFEANGVRRSYSMNEDQ